MSKKLLPLILSAIILLLLAYIFFYQNQKPLNTNFDTALKATHQSIFDHESGSSFDLTSELYKSFFNGPVNITGLNHFMTLMPKGGDLHHHYTGTIYAETYLEWVKRKDWLIDSCTLRIIKNKDLETLDCPLLTVDELLKDGQRFRKLLTLWSDKDYDNHYHQQPPPDHNFFSTFGYFGPISNEYMDEGLQIIKERAVLENVSYIETMLTSLGVKSNKYLNLEKADYFNQRLRQASSQDQVNQTLDELVNIFNQDNRMRDTINDFVNMAEDIHQGIDDEDFMMRFQTYAVRTRHPVRVFLDLYGAYLAANQSPLIVGVNIVAPENHHVALQDYTLHMRMYNYLLNRYPNVRRALHAGELTTGMVRPKDLQFHIREAIDIAKAERIGHGIDIPYENKSIKTLADLKKRDVAIEINLKSNEFILGVQNQEHPYTLYAQHDVPMVISTDDSGVSRNNLANEYVLLASRYQPDYKTVKKHVYNSIKYSFASDRDQKTLRSLLDQRFKDFENQMANLYRKVSVKQ